MIFLLIMAFTGMALVEVPGLIRKKYWRELIVFVFLMLVGFILSLLLTLGINLPTWSRVIEYVFGGLLHMGYK